MELLGVDDGEWSWAEYSTFRVDSETSGYSLTIGGYSGNAGDAFDYRGFVLNGAKFSTKDRDNDVSLHPNCAAVIQSGFWYTLCGYVRINARQGVNLGFVWIQQRLQRSRAMLIRN